MWTATEAIMRMKAHCCVAAENPQFWLCWWSIDCVLGLRLFDEDDRPRDGMEALQFFNKCWGQMLVAVAIVESECSIPGGYIIFCCDLA